MTAQNDSTVRTLRIRNTVTFTWEDSVDTDAFGDPLSDEAMKQKLEEQLAHEPFDFITQATNIAVESTVEIIT